MNKKTGIKIALTAAAAFSALTLADGAQATMMNGQKANGNMQAERNSCKGSPRKGQEKCYGIAKKGMNSCATAKHKCAGLSKIDGDPNEWMTVQKGNCERIVGGSLTSMSSQTDDDA